MILIRAELSVSFTIIWKKWKADRTKNIKEEKEFGKEKDSVIICYWHDEFKRNGRGVCFYNVKR
ncbi:hypothetical protein EMIT079MI2_80109 [Bacillus sp. IT-79MI2]